MAAQTCEDVVHRISSSSGQELMEALQDLSALVNSPSYNLREIAPLVPTYLLFGCLNTKNAEQILLCTRILTKLLSVEKADAIIKNYRDYVIEGLNHPVYMVRDFCFGELAKCSASINGLLALLDNVDLLVYITRSLDDDSTPAKEASKILINVAKHDSGLELVFQHQIQSELESLLQKNSIIRCRVYDLTIQIQALSDKAFEGCKKCGILEKLTKELDTDDPLMRLSCLELLKELANSGQNGLMFVEESGFVTKLHNLLLSEDGDSLMHFVLPGIVRFFGNLAQSRPVQVAEKYPAFFQKLVSFLKADDYILRMNATQTVGAIARSEMGLRVVFDDKNPNGEVMKILFFNIRSPEGDLNTLSLEALASIFFSADMPSDDLSEVTKRLFDAMAPRPLQVLMEVSKQPFQDVHCAVLQMLTSLAKYKWAQKDMTTCPGFLEYLLDRTTETAKTGREHKYDLIVALVRSPFSKEVFGKPFYLRLQEYEREGPFYVRAQGAVAFEGED
ncbi:26S proteasome non-ATPase regulatory subunit 5-like [Montipora capricornis]|uniref:26S proteasome non-ATPase regulatory subunit 5-like n=1 Tax=Montipora capricornis TaxID=246305 RepID=UPI0035F1FF7A